MNKNKDYNTVLKNKLEILFENMAKNCSNETAKNKIFELASVLKNIKLLSEIATDKEFLLKKKELGKVLIKITYPETENISMRFWSRLSSIIKSTDSINNMTDMWVFLFVLGTVEIQRLHSLSPYTIEYSVKRNNIKLILNCDVLTNDVMKNLHTKLSVINSEIKNITNSSINIDYIVNYCSEETIIDIWLEDEYKNMSIEFIQIK